MLRILAMGLMLVAVEAIAEEHTVTECDRVASHPDDPDRAAPGVERADIDLPAALAICEARVAEDPTDLRARYQYARVLFYSGQNKRAMAEMRAAADAGYRQAQFVYGTFISYGRQFAPKDICMTEDYWLKSARAGRQAARVSYVRHYLKGRFDGCKVQASREEMTGFIDSAEKEADNFYERLLIEDLGDALAKTAPTVDVQHSTAVPAADVQH